MTTNNNDNANTNQKPGEYKENDWDWREMRRKRRREWREARYRFPFRGLFPGLILILLGTLFMLNQAGWISGDTWWQYLLLGLGSIFIINGLLVYLTRPHWFRVGQFVAGFILISLGAIFLLGLTQWWPVTLIAIGVVLILYSFLIWQFRRNVKPS